MKYNHLKYHFLRFIAQVKIAFNQQQDDHEFKKNNRRTRVKEISQELLNEPLSERLIMLKKINDVVLISSFKQQNEYKSFVEEQDELLKNFKL